ncbi:MAG: glycosyltransferase, partial [Anaerolineae bacterium]|nr:glycosyltransferase [Anaerolineae bacterium]
MHILHVTPYYAPAWAFGGVVSAVSGLAAAQAARGHRVTVLTTDALDVARRNPLHREVIDGVVVVRCRNVSHALRAKLNFSSPRRWRSTFAVLQPPDVIHMHEVRTV